MKHLLYIVCFLILGHTANAQLFSKERIKNQENFDKQRLTWGFFLGYNSFDFKFEYEQDLPDILVQRTGGFNVGLISDLRINDYINLRFEPGLIITERTLQYDPIYFAGTNFNDNDLLRDVKSTYIYFPLLVKFSTKRINNFKPFISGGFATALNLSSNEKNPEDNESGEFRMTQNNYFYELSFGIDFYLYWFKFTPSIKGVFSINDENIRDVDPNSPWTGNIQTMQTRGVFLNFTFQ